MYNLTSPSHHIGQYHLPKELMFLFILHLSYNICCLPITRKEKTCDAGVCPEVSLPLGKLKA